MGYEALSSHLEVEGIPTAASADPEGAEFPWRSKPVNSLESVADGLNDSATLIVLCEKASSDEKAEIAAALAEPAREIMAAARSAGEDPELVFATAELPDDNIAAQVRKLAKLDDGFTSMIILDIPDDGAYYVWRPEEKQAVSETAVRAFVEAYKAKSLERLQLG